MSDSLEKLFKDSFIPELVSTEVFAQAINRSPQTIRKWHCLDCAPMGIRPIKINGRLSWRVSDIQKLMEGATL